MNQVAPAHHQYVDLSDLNAKWDQALPAVAGLGSSNGSLSGNSLGVVAAGVGASPTYPWGEYSPDTVALQKAVNQALVKNGYARIGEDGTLGPSTCGAIREICGSVTDCEVPGTCQSFTAPARAGGGGGSLPRSSSTPVVTGRIGGGPNWALIGGAVAAIAIGGALLVKAKKGRR